MASACVCCPKPQKYLHMLMFHPHWTTAQAEAMLLRVKQLTFHRLFNKLPFLPLNNIIDAGTLIAIKT